MHPDDLAILLHRALEVRLEKLQEGLAPAHWAEDEEQLHQVRVAARRLGAVLDLVDPAAYPGHKRHRRALKRLVKVLGLPREQDVFAACLRRHRAEARTATQEAILEHLLEQVDRGRARARRAMHKGLDGLRLPRLDRLREGPIPRPSPRSLSLQAAAWACLEPRSLAALGDLHALRAEEDSAALHQGRIRIKKLRYALEALEGAFAPAPEAALAGLRALQTVLGEHHDLAALEALLWETEADLRTRDRAVLCGGILDLLGDLAETRREVFERFCAQARGQSPAAFARALRPALGLHP